MYQEARQRGISFAPGQIFSAQGSGYCNSMRISFGRPFDGEVERAIETLGNLIKDRL